MGQFEYRLGRPELTKGTKVRIINAMVIPTLTYRYKIWTVQASHKGQIQATKMRVDRGAIKIR